MKTSLKIIILIIIVVLLVGYCDMFWKQADIDWEKYAIEFNNKLDYYNYRVYYKFSKTMNCTWCERYEFQGKYIVLYDKYNNVLERFERHHVWYNGIKDVKTLKKMSLKRPSGTIVLK